MQQTADPISKGMDRSRQRSGGERLVALLLLCALLVNLASPGIAFARIANSDFFTSAICHSGKTAPEQPAETDPGKACPICALFAAAPIALPSGATAKPLAAPRLTRLPPARGPPAALPRTATPNPYPARGPPPHA